MEPKGTISEDVSQRRASTHRGRGSRRVFRDAHQLPAAARLTRQSQLPFSVGFAGAGKDDDDALEHTIFPRPDDSRRIIGECGSAPWKPAATRTVTDNMRLFISLGHSSNPDTTGGAKEQSHRARIFLLSRVKPRKKKKPVALARRCLSGEPSFNSRVDSDIARHVVRRQAWHVTHLTQLGYREQRQVLDILTGNCTAQGHWDECVSYGDGDGLY